MTTTSYGGLASAVVVGFAHTAVLRLATHTPTMTPTATSTATLSPTFTPTPQMTLTPSFADCGLPTTALADGGPLTLRSAASCLQIVEVGAGSDAWTARAVGVRVAALPAPLILSLLDGCPTTGAGCTVTITAADAGSDLRLPLATATAATLRLLYGSAPATGLQTQELATPDVTLYAARSGSALFLSVVCALTAVVSALAVVGIWLGYQLWRTRKSARRFQQRSRYNSRRFQFVFSVAGWTVMVGALWLIIVACSSSPTIQPLGLFIAAATIAGIGFCVCAASLIWAERDSEHLICVPCGKPVSRWHFIGTYLPTEDGDRQKAHSKHIRCVMCGEKVVTDCWPESPKHRRYHTACWDKHCAAAVADEGYTQRWVTGPLGAAVTQTELAHLLAAAVKQSARPTIAVLTDLAPELSSAPVSGDHSRTAIHIAARVGNLSILQLLLQSTPSSLDPVCPIDRSSVPSLSIKGMDDSNDVYLHQPFVTLNDRPLYIGHSQGKYLFYYDPTTDTKSKVRNAAGWCLSPYLGSGSSPFRLPLPDPQADKVLPNEHRDHDRQKLLWLSERLYGSRPARTDRATSHSSSSTETDKTDSPPPSPHNIDQHEDTRVPHPPTTSPDFPRPQEMRMEVEAEVIAVQVEWLGHTQSLLEDAIVSGDHDTIRYVTQLYKAQDPGCMLWYHLSGHGLWDVYPPPAQAEIRRAMERQQGQVTLGSYRSRHGESVTLDLEDHLHRTPSGVRRPIRSVMRASFQHRESPEHPFVLTSDVASILNWNTAVVVLTPGHLANACPDEATLDLLVTEGITDYALWSPPCKVGTRSPEICNASLENIFHAVFHKAVGRVMGLSGAAFTLHAANATRRADRDCAAPEGGAVATGIGGRLTDGLDHRPSDITAAFYPPGYTSDTGCLPFCAQLPENSLGYTFALLSIVKMAADSLMKTMEMQRQGFEHKARDIIAVFVYTYELQYDDRQAGSQIYGEMNKAMRLKHAKHIEYWRPLIWEIDVALEAFPSYRGKAFRGINCTIDPAEYRVGSKICWPSFSSGSQDRGVAEEFAKGESGTLFFLTSVNAKPISAISRFPEEAEVLFPPNTVFEVTSFLLGASEIGAFYGRVDNIAMAERTGMVSLIPDAGPARAARRVRIIGHTSFLLHVPTDLSHRTLDLLAAAGVQVLESTGHDAREDGYVAELLLSPEDPS